MQPPRRISGTDPQLTPQAQRAGIQGLMVVRLHIGEDGRVRDVNIMRGLALMDEHVKRVLMGWRFSPPVHRGRRIPIYLVQRIRFQMEG
jgi:TonB family protein